MSMDPMYQTWLPVTCFGVLFLDEKPPTKTVPNQPSKGPKASWNTSDFK